MFAATMSTTGGGGLTQFGESRLVFHSLCVDDNIAGVGQFLCHLPERQFDDVGCHIAHTQLQEQNALVTMRF